ncbi:MAG: homoserine dehydrogenase [Oscillospiraceae bacterium]|nr:homoserine dehydrogenase [Oscillospiraceae bacterium]
MTKAAIMGYGTVGSGVAEVLAGNPEKIAWSARQGVELKYILDVRDFPESPFADKIIHDFAVIESDPEVSVVAECIGGATIAYEYVRRCLEAHKSVATSNKELIAEKGLELLGIARDNGVSLMFEGAVGGGIPIIRTLTQYFSGNKINEVFGILNATTNYILTQMNECGLEFGEVLKDAQRRGYAEADPTADVDGIDACRKICILADLSFSRNISPAWVKTTGVRSMTSADTAFAEEMGCAIKLLGRSLRRGDKVTAYVAPHLIPRGKVLYDVNGVMNAVVVNAEGIGDCIFTGAGAGKLPTASAVVADMADAVRHAYEEKRAIWESADESVFFDSDELVSRWYVRSSAAPVEMKRAFDGAVYTAGGECAVLTQPMDARQLAETAGRIPLLSAFRVLD